MCPARPSISFKVGMRVRVLQSLSRFFSPLAMMKDVSRGSFEERIAAYRHNRRMRGSLAACIRHWALSCSVAVVLTALFDALGGSGNGPLSIFVLLAAACGTFIACAVCMLFVMGYAYVYLTHHDW
jgi:ABC-type transport system involved in cytochrome c biogenesis permease component